MLTQEELKEWKKKDIYYIKIGLLHIFRSNAFSIASVLNKLNENPFFNQKVYSIYFGEQLVGRGHFK